MRPRLGRARWTRPWLLAAGALIAALSACSSDLFHSTDWPTRCDTKPDDPGCPGTTSTGAGGAGSTTATTSSSGGGKGGGSATTATTGAGGSAGGGGTKDGG